MIDRPITELLVVMWVDGGAYLDSLTVEYSADGTEYSTQVQWSMVACGEKVIADEACPTV